LRTNFFNTIGYNDDLINTPRNRPESSTECNRFRASLRKNDFLNPTVIKSNFESFCGESKLSDQLKDFTNLAKQARQDYIIEVFDKKNINPPIQCIPVTQQEENELKMTRAGILKRIEQLLNQVDDNIKYSTIVSKKKSELLNILNELENEDL
jgi:hypothetical protein